MFTQEDKRRSNNRAAWGLGEYPDWLRYEAAVVGRHQRENLWDRFAPPPTDLEDERYESHTLVRIDGRLVCSVCGVQELFACWSTCEERIALMEAEPERLRKAFVKAFEAWIENGCPLLEV